MIELIHESLSKQELHRESFPSPTKLMIHSLWLFGMILELHSQLSHV